MQALISQQIKNVLHKLHAGGFPSAIVAGGAIRDLIFGKPVKDIDVFVSYEDLARWYTTDHIAHFENAIEREVVKEDWSSYIDIPDVDSVYSVFPLGEELPVQIIVMKPGLSPVERVSLLDFGFCQAYSDGEVDYKFTRSFFDDFTHQTITLSHCENQHEFDRSMIRYERLKLKYPEFKLVIPREFRQYQSLIGDLDFLNHVLGVS